MKKYRVIALMMVLFSIFFSGCFLPVFGNRETLPKPETALEFWIAENVDDVDFSKYQIRDGQMGGTAYYGTGYVPTIAENGERVEPEHCVVYTVTSYPDYVNKEQHVTTIRITDPEIEVYGITLRSSFEEFERLITAQGFEIKQKDENFIRAEKGKYTITLSETVMYICVNVTNLMGIVF